MAFPLVRMPVGGADELPSVTRRCRGCCSGPGALEPVLNNPLNPLERFFSLLLMVPPPLCPMLPSNSCGVGGWEYPPRLFRFESRRESCLGVSREMEEPFL